MTRQFVRMSVAAAAILGLASVASAQGVVVTMPDSGSVQTTFNANVAEQVRLIVPTAVAFDVRDKNSNTASSAQTVTADDIVLSSNTHGVKISIQAGAASFTPPIVGSNTYSAGDLSWNAASWSNAGVGASGTMSSSAFNEVVTCAHDVVKCETTNLVFTLAANSGIQYSGTHHISATWKVESVVP